jgi:prepilin-type N-terminal cleavage/methylation domain-containing protein
MRTRCRSGFTLLEMVLVCAITVIFAAISYPAIEAMYAGARLEGASDSVRAAWAEAQAHAVNESRAYRFAVVPGKGNYRVAPDSAEFWTGDGGHALADPDNPAYVLESSLPTGMVFPEEGGSVPDVVVHDSSLPDDGVPVGQWVTHAVFLADGTAQDDAEVFLKYPGTRPITLRLRGLTGTTTVLRGE